MKHLVRFNESYNMNKEVSFTEDLLLKFRDSGELSNYDVKYFGDTIDIDLLFNEHIVGEKKIVAIDNIIDRLRKRYKYILIRNNVILIDMKEKSHNVSSYLKNSLRHNFEHTIFYSIKNLKQYKTENTNSKYYNYIFFTYNETYPSSMYYSINDRAMIIKTSIIKNLWYQLMSDEDVKLYLKDALKKIINLPIEAVENSSIIPTVNDLVKIN